MIDAANLDIEVMCIDEHGVATLIFCKTTLDAFQSMEQFVQGRTDVHCVARLADQVRGLYVCNSRTTFSIREYSSFCIRIMSTLLDH